MHAGNILNIKTYAYNKPSNEDLNSFKKIDEFTYACDGWKDQLIDFNGKQIAYDSMGRPTTYKNMEFKWNTLNQLEEIPELHVIYEYDSLGIRNKKDVNGSETKIITEGTKILKVIKDKKYEIIFTYSLNKLIGFIYTKDGISKEYIYIRNIQGDIKSICDNKGRIVASYEYNAYGNCIITENIDDIANINPFRYRGYYYDEETGLYYLNSRYYDPETGRFISPDTLSILDETKGQINGLNLYMYCGDNPVMYVDPSGYFFFTAILVGVFAGALIGGAAGGIYAAVNGQDFWTGALSGLAIGALIGLGIGLGVGLIGVGFGMISAASSIGTMVLGGLAIAGGLTSAGLSVYAVGSNIAKVIHSYDVVSKYGDLGYSDIVLNGDNSPNSIDTSILKDDETIMKYVNYLYEKVPGIKGNWTKEQLYCELKYHALGNNNSILNLMFGSHLESADVEINQEFRTYFLRFFGNMLW